MATRMQMRRGTAAEWTAANPTLAAGEIGVVTDDRTVKIGDGLTVWNSLAYLFDSTYATDAELLTVQQSTDTAQVTANNAQTDATAAKTTASNALSAANAAHTLAEKATRGPIVHVWDTTTSTHKLADGQTDDGVSPRWYLAPSANDPTTQTGHVSRVGDMWIKTA